MQFMDGGSDDKNIKRLMQAHARAAAGTPSTNLNDNNTLPIGDVYRDDKGGIWWDHDEQLEYTHLLAGDAHAGGDDQGMMQWVTFGETTLADGEDDPALALATLTGLGRRSSSTSTKTTDSDVDPANLVKPADEDPGMIHINLPGLYHLPPPTTTTKPNPQPQPILSISTRPTPPHLRKTPQFLLDLAAFSPSPSPSPSPFCLLSPRNPPTHNRPISPIHTAFPTPCTSRLRAKARRIPTPLNLVSVTTARGTSASVLSGPQSADPVLIEQGRQDFIDSSFEPAPLSLGLAPPPSPVEMVCRPVVNVGLKKKTSRIGFTLFSRRE